MTSNHLNISFVEKSPEKSLAVCVWLTLECAFSTHWVSSTKVFISTAKCMHSSLVPKVFVPSTKHVHVWSVILCSEVSSKDCPVASDKRIGLLNESWFRTPSKTNRTKGKSFSKKFISNRDVKTRHG